MLHSLAPYKIKWTRKSFLTLFIILGVITTSSWLIVAAPFSPKETTPVLTKSLLTSDTLLPQENELKFLTERELQNSENVLDIQKKQKFIIEKMNEMILMVKDKSEVVVIANKISQLSSSRSFAHYPIVKLYGSIAALVPYFQGIIYRCREFVEKSDWIHMAALFGLRDIKYNNYLYGSHMEALFDFVTYPSNKVGEPFKSVSELQDFLLFQIAPLIENYLETASTLEQLPSEVFEFDFNRNILVGNREGIRFIDEEEMSKLFIKPYFYTVNFLIQRVLATIYYVSSIDLNELPIVFNKVLKKTTINNFLGDVRLGEPAVGVTPEMTYEIIKGTNSFLNWRKKSSNNNNTLDVKLNLNRSFELGLSSSFNQLAAYVCGLRYPDLREKDTILQITDKTKECTKIDQWDFVNSYHITRGSYYLFNPNSMVLNFKKKYNMFFNRYNAFVKASKGDYAQIISDATGKPLQVNVKAFFNVNVPPRALLPTGYQKVSTSSPSTIEGVIAWNYDHGKPMEFKDYTFGGFFHQSEVYDTNSLYQAMVTLLYTDSISPFAIFIRVPSPARYFIPPSEIIDQ